MNDPYRGDPEIDTDVEVDIGALLADIDAMRAAIVRAAPGLAGNHHNYVRVSAVEQLVGKAMKYIKAMK